MRIQWKRLLLCLALPLAVGGLAALLVQGDMALFEALKKPPLAPPGWLFPVAWTILYLLMGLASYLVLVSGGPRQEIRRAWKVYIGQLAVNFFWPILFFSFQLYFPAFFWLVFLWALILITLRRFWRLSSPAGLLLLPYLLWVSFAGYLNLGVALLN